MNDDQYFRLLVENEQVRVSSRAIIVNSSADRYLVEKNSGSMKPYYNFVGGGVELGESLQSCLEREIKEELDVKIIRMAYLFVVENLITYKGVMTHGVEHYFEVELANELLKPDGGEVEVEWFTLREIRELDL